jgi:hypothetical protein
LAASRAALSVSATVGVALATLLVVGGILAGPAILECSSDPNGFGACLRDRVADSGLLAPDAERTEQPGVVADISSEPSLPPAPAGWMEANANEYEPPIGAPVDLTGSPAEIAAVEVALSSEAAVEVAVVPPVEIAAGVPLPVEAPVAVTLDGTEPSLLAEGASSSAPVPATEVALVGPQGGVTAISPAPEVTLDAAAALTQPDGLLVETPVAGPIVPLVELRAEASVEPVEVPPPAIEFNPQYPNVLVLPPPATGDNSSFRSLQLN